jgi:hypothetical protein
MLAKTTNKLSTNKLYISQSNYYLNCYKVSFSKWFISEELLPVLGLDVQFFNCLLNKSKEMKNINIKTTDN